MADEGDSCVKRIAWGTSATRFHIKEMEKRLSLEGEKQRTNMNNTLEKRRKGEKKSRSATLLNFEKKRHTHK